MPKDHDHEIALLIPCYNAGRYLPELFEGVRAQTVPFKEIICYDDASMDDTAAIARSLGAKVIKGSVNRGAAYARNRLIEATSCDWVHFHDADDLIEPRFVEFMTENIKQYNVPVLCSMRVLDRDSRSLRALVSYKELNHTDDFVASFLENEGYAIIGVYPVKALKTIGGFREILRGNEDPDLHVRLAMAGYSFYGEEKVLVTCLEHGLSFCATDWNRCMEDRLICLTDYAGRMDPKYYPILGKQVLNLAWRLYAYGNKHGARKAFNLAELLTDSAMNSDLPHRIEDIECVISAKRLSLLSHFRQLGYLLTRGPNDVRRYFLRRILQAILPNRMYESLRRLWKSIRR
jgi:glycosyltransferase involved in cell wall biosynthesis